MAKKRKSIFDTTTSNEEIKDAALNVQKETLKSSPIKKYKVDLEEEETHPVHVSIQAKKEEKSGKLMHLYVDGEHHKQAKVNATLRGMKLGAYIEWLIEQDKKSIKY